MYDDDEMINELWRRAVPYLLFGCGMIAGMVICRICCLLHNHGFVYQRLSVFNVFVLIVGSATLVLLPH